MHRRASKVRSRGREKYETCRPRPPSQEAMKASAILLLLVAGCCRPAAVPVVRITAPPPAPSIPAPAVIASFPPPAIAQPQRNVFAFRAAERRRLTVRHDVVVPPNVVQPPSETQKQEIVVEPVPASRYLGAFGPQENPILVFKKSDNVVNVALRKP